MKKKKRKELLRTDLIDQGGEADSLLYYSSGNLLLLIF